MLTTTSEHQNKAVEYKIIPPAPSALLQVQKCVQVGTLCMVLIFISTFWVKLYPHIHKSSCFFSSARILNTLSSVLWGHCGRVARAIRNDNRRKTWRLEPGRVKKKLFSVSPPHVFCRVGKSEVESCSKGLQGQNKQPAWSSVLLQKILLSLKFPASRAKERGGGGWV